MNVKILRKPFKKLLGKQRTRARQNIKVRKPGILSRGEIRIKTSKKKHRFNFMTSKEVFTEYLQELEKVVPDCF